MTSHQAAAPGQDVWKVGELARATGLTVPTLHHWDDLGLVSPTRDPFSGHRYYTGSDVERVYQVLAQRQETEADQIAQVQNAWPDLIGRVSSAVENGTDPTSEAGRALGREWQELLAQFHRGDEDLRESLFAMQAENAEQIRREHGGPSPEQLDFIRRATA